MYKLLYIAIQCKILIYAYIGMHIKELEVDRLNKIFDEHDEREPLFLYFAPQNPHSPSQPTNEFLAMYSDEEFPDFTRRAYYGIL